MGLPPRRRHLLLCAVQTSLAPPQALTRLVVSALTDDKFALFASCINEREAKNWLFVGSELAGQRAAMVMSLVQSAKLNKLDPWAYLRDVLACIHSHPASHIDALLPHCWRPS